MSSHASAYIIIGLAICLAVGWAVAWRRNWRLSRRRRKHGVRERINLFR